MKKQRELLFSITKKDFKIDTFRAGGKGGQNQNKRDSGVRITHIATGLSTESREHKAQPANKKAAFNKLVVKLKPYISERIGIELDKVKGRYLAGKKVVRTYNEASNRVVDMFGNKHSHRDTIGKSNIGPLIESLAAS